ncbi:glycogen debranching N-terminal domain-containing protein [Microbacterium sp. B2969]|uniref:Glycogen debranching N-terminal domain-containing protein n=1 Tax=Microbacterium alkaliflavum TaxID=3248839 RepID=A0ABW7Q3Y1_9MICO
MTEPSAHPLQPLLNDSVIAFRAPTQVWSAASGDLGVAPIHGMYHGDLRPVREAVLTCDGASPEWISMSPDGPSRIVFGGLLRALDDPSPDPRVRLLREREVADGAVGETITLVSRVAHDIDTTLLLRVVPDFAPMQEVKAGTASTRPWQASGAVGVGAPFTVTSGAHSFTVSAPEAQPRIDGDALVLMWDAHVAAGEAVSVSWSLSFDDPSLVVRGVIDPANAVAPTSDAPRDPRIDRWLDGALGDLDALRLALPDHPKDEFYAAGAPWFFTLFGRDSLWAARLALPVDVGMAASTLRVLARLQGDRVDAATAQQPGKIPHELRSAPLSLPGEDVLLPPLYYGTVDATLLWVCLLAEALDAGMPRDEVAALVPSLQRALSWMTDYGDGSGHGFIDYIDETGHGLANQGWKDSGDSIQWRDGTLARGPIALCEVQGYAYEAARRGADLLDALGESGGDDLRSWGAALRERFRSAFWVETPEGRYPAIALDADQRPVDTLTSNIGHLIGTGILDPEEESHVASLLLGASMSSGFGIRTMSTGAAGYWPLSYHGGSVWPHDTAIAVHGMTRAGLHDEALQVVDGLLASAEGFAFRVPELFSGDPATDTATPTPYPAACRPQAWSAAAAVTCAEAVRAARVSRPS